MLALMLTLTRRTCPENTDLLVLQLQLLLVVTVLNNIFSKWPI